MSLTCYHVSYSASDWMCNLFGFECLQILFYSTYQNDNWYMVLCLVDKTDAKQIYFSGTDILQIGSMKIQTISDFQF